MSSRSTQQTQRIQAAVSQGWLDAVASVERVLKTKSSESHLTVDIPVGAPVGSDVTARAMRLAYGVYRNMSRLRGAIESLSRKLPSARIRAILYVAGFELMEARDDGERARITHHAVEGAKVLLSAREVGFVNAMLHRMPAAINEEPPAIVDRVGLLAWRYSHPAWLVERWLEQFGEMETIDLLKWNQQPAEVYIRLEPGTEPLEGLEPTRWPAFYRRGSADWAAIKQALDARRIYVQDPFTLHPVDLLDPKPGERILDLCSAPGGKARLIASRMEGYGMIVCVDVPGPRMNELAANLPECEGNFVVEHVACDFLEDDLSAVLMDRDLPVEYDAVLLDVPCSSTGVMRRKPEMRWNLEPTFIQFLADSVQTKMLETACLFARKGGRAVYSTCSLERDENEDVAEAVAANWMIGATLTAKKLSRPWQDGHDGGGAFRFEIPL